MASLRLLVAAAIYTNYARPLTSRLTELDGFGKRKLENWSALGNGLSGLSSRLCLKEVAWNTCKKDGHLRRFPFVSREPFLLTARFGFSWPLLGPFNFLDLFLISLNLFSTCLRLTLALRTPNLLPPLQPLFPPPPCCNSPCVPMYTIIHNNLQVHRYASHSSFREGSLANFLKFPFWDQFSSHTNLGGLWAQFFSVPTEAMARFLQALVPQLKKAALYLGLNPEVATKNWPSRGTYRVAPASAPAPSFTHNFPLKQDQVADLQFQDRAERITREAMHVPVAYAHTNFRRDARNIWNTVRRSSTNSINASSTKAAHNLPRMGQVSERQELSL